MIHHVATPLLRLCLIIGLKESLDETVLVRHNLKLYNKEEKVYIKIKNKLNMLTIII
jgi:hypothetical protein